MNKLIFPSPVSSYSKDQLFGDLVYIPRKTDATNIPCLWLPHLNGGSSKLMIYFHANAEDVGLCYEMLDHIRSTVRINILAPEYPGYGVYTHSKGVQEGVYGNE